MACSKYWPTYRELAQCYSKVEKVIDKLNKFAEDLDKHKFNANVSKAVGGASATVGSVLVIGGAIASVFTLGVSTVLIPAGIAVGAVGGGTVAGTAITEIVIKKKKLQKAQKLWDSILNDPVMQEYLTEIDDPDIGTACSDIVTGATRGIKAGLQIGGQIAQAAGKSALQAAKISVRVLAVAGAAFEAVLLPLSLYDLINSSIEAHEKTKCTAGDVLRKVAQTFETVRDRLLEQLDQPAIDFNAEPLKSS